jgi:hypothetical protein
MTLSEHELANSVEDLYAGAIPPINAGTISGHLAGQKALGKHSPELPMLEWCVAELDRLRIVQRTDLRDAAKATELMAASVRELSELTDRLRKRLELVAAIIGESEGER